MDDAQEADILIDWQQFFSRRLSHSNTYPQIKDSSALEQIRLRSRQIVEFTQQKKKNGPRR